MGSAPPHLKGPPKVVRTGSITGVGDKNPRLDRLSYSLQAVPVIYGLSLVGLK
jgi:hypothetical protein